MTDDRYPCDVHAPRKGNTEADGLTIHSLSHTITPSKLEWSLELPTHAFDPLVSWQGCGEASARAGPGGSEQHWVEKECDTIDMSSGIESGEVCGVCVAVTSAVAGATAGSSLGMPGTGGGMATAFVSARSGSL